MSFSLVRSVSLRGLRVIASWINDWDLKEQQTLDMYVEEGGRKFLRRWGIRHRGS